MAEEQDWRQEDQLGGDKWSPSEYAQQPVLGDGAGEKSINSRDIEEVDWLRLGNDQHVGGKGERETKDDSWALGCQQVGRSWSQLLRQESLGEEQADRANYKIKLNRFGVALPR